MFKKSICRNHYFSGKEIKLFTGNEYFQIIRKEDLDSCLNNQYLLYEFKNTERFIDQIKNFDSTKEVVVKIILEDNKKYFIEDYEDISCFDIPKFKVLNSITNENKHKFVKSLKEVIHIPSDCF